MRTIPQSLAGGHALQRIDERIDYDSRLSFLGAEAETILSAPAKLTLALRVCGHAPKDRRALDMAVAFSLWGDSLRIRPALEPIVRISGRHARGLAQSPRARNLVWRAMHFGSRPARLSVRLEKRIPLAAGLGGGSADAAALLRHRTRIETGFSLPSMDRLAYELGADIPACLGSIPQRVSGIGEECAMLSSLPEWGIVIACLPFALETARVFAHGDAIEQVFLPPPPRRRHYAEWQAWLRIGENGLAKPAKRLCPRIATVLEAFKNCPLTRYAGLAGSGPACFALCLPGQEARLGTQFRRRGGQTLLSEKGEIVVSRLAGSARAEKTIGNGTRASHKTITEEHS